MALQGIELDDVEPGQLIVMSVDTDEGPGLALRITYRVEDGPDTGADDADGGETQ